MADPQFKSLLGNSLLAATTLKERTSGRSAPYIKVVAGVATMVLKNFDVFKKVRDSRVVMPFFTEARRLRSTKTRGARSWRAFSTFSACSSTSIPRNLYLNIYTFSGTTRQTLNPSFNTNPKNHKDSSTPPASPNSKYPAEHQTPDS